MEIKRFEEKYPALTMHDEVKKTLNLLEAGNFVQVVGLPGTGKSTLLRLLAYNSEVKKLHLGSKTDTYHFVYMNFVEVAKRNISEVTKYMLISLQSSLSERGTSEAEYVKKQLSEAILVNDEMVYFQNLKQSVEYMSSKGIKTVLLIDRLEYYFSYMDERFFANLRVLRNSAKYSFSAVFSLNRPLDMTLERALMGEIYDLVAGNTVFVGITHPEGVEFRMRHLEEITGKSCSDEIKSALLKLAAGHGKLTKVGYEAVLERSCGQEEMEEFLLSRRQVRGALSEIWNYFTLEEKRVLLGKVKNGDVDKFLASLGIQRDGEITIPLLKGYIEEKSKELTSLSYETEKRAIMRGGVDITEIFSPSEFRLVRYLLEHKGVIVPRDELVDYIWGELATREGVTPQAFDQLLYRVRKKIEEDPSSPKILTTIKGQGYRLKS